MNDPVAAFNALADALGLATRSAAIHERPWFEASGTVRGFAISIGRLWPYSQHLPIRIETVARDIQLEVFTRTPRHVHQRVDAMYLDALWVRGPGELVRLRALLAGNAGARLRDAAHLEVHVTDHAVLAFIPLHDDAAALRAEAERLIGLAAALDEDASQVPVEPSLRWAEPELAAAASTLGLVRTTCPLGLRGLLGGCRVYTRTLWMRPQPRMFVHIELRQPIDGTWAVRSQGRGFWRRARGGLNALVGNGPGSGRFAFDRRFYVDGDRGDAMRAVASHLDALIEFVDRDWLSVTGSRVLLGFPMKRGRLPPLAALLPRAVAIAHLVGGAPTIGAPFR